MPLLLVRLLNLRPRFHALLLVGGAAVCVLVGGAVFALTQPTTAITTGWYWALTTASTVGYGDVTPKNAAGRIVASAVMVTAIPLLAGAFAVLTGSAVAKGVRRLLEMGATFPQGTYVLVLGMHRSVQVALEELDRAKRSVVLIADVEPSEVPNHVHFVRGDPTLAHVLERGRPAGAERVLIAVDDDGDAMVAAVLVHQLAPTVPMTALVGSPRLLPALKDLGVDQALSPDDLVGHTLAKGMEAPHSSDVLMELVRGEGHRLFEEEVAAGEPDRPLSAVRAQRGDLVIGVVQDGRVSLGVSSDPTVRPGDYLVLVEPDGSRTGHSARATSTTVPAARNTSS
jgi:voltage-gated potassium channel